MFFPTIDEVTVSAFYGSGPGSVPRPTVILVHEVGNPAGAQEWLFTQLFEAMLESGYNVLAVDLRGSGETPLPDDGREDAVLLFSDLEDMHLEVRAAITWLRNQPSADNARLGVIGSGIGGNVAFVSMGAFPEDLRVGVALSPGLWTADLEPLVVGDGIDSFAPHSILYVAGAEDFGVINEAVISFSDYAQALASVTQDPGILVVPDVADHGVDLLNTPGATELILDWLQAHL